MRIISQGGHADLPYELVELEILEVKNELKTMYSKGFMVVACAPCNHANLIDLSKNHVIGVYSTGENAKKAMEMCREQYAWCKIRDNGMNSLTMAMSFRKTDEIEQLLKTFAEKNIFQFPADEDVE
jgi:hypothetical protein